MKFKKYDTYEEWQEKDPEGLQKAYEDYKDDYLFQSLKMERAGLEMLEGRLSKRQYVDMRLAVRNEKIRLGKAPTSLNDAIVKRQAYGNTPYDVAQSWAQLYKETTDKSLGWDYRETVMKLRQSQTRKALLSKWKAEGMDVEDFLNKQHKKFQDDIKKDLKDHGWTEEAAEAEANRQAYREVSQTWFDSK